MVEKTSLNPFQGLVGVSTKMTEKTKIRLTESQSLSGFGWCFYNLLKNIRLGLEEVSIPFRVWLVFLQSFQMEQGRV